MWKRISHYLFKKPDDIGFDNYLVLVFCLLAAILGLLGSAIDLGLGIGSVSSVSSAIAAVIYITFYIYSWRTNKYIVSKFGLIILSLALLTLQYFVNYGSSGPILYIFVIIQSFVLLLFKNPAKLFLSLAIFANVTILFLLEHFYPSLVGNYASDSVRLMDLYSGVLIYLILTVLLLNFALRFYRSEREKAQLADRLKSAFLANMSHEIRTPMNGILGFAELLKEPNLSGDEQQQYISIIEKSGDRMLNVINDIIDISKIESGLIKVDIHDTNINDQIEYIYNFFRHEVESKGVKLSYKISLPEDQAIIKTDSEKLYAILLNLVKNAIKFTHEGCIEFGYNIKANGVQVLLEFYVKDTGIGIPKDRQEAIFERFVQADITDTHAYQGAGLGLSISKAYVEMLSGKIDVISESGIGSVFYFTIPYNPKLDQKPVIENPHIEEVSTTSIFNLKILIAEDDMASEILISREVKKYCRELLKVKTGLAAVEACRNNPDTDLILMDIKMPKMDGYEATREIRKFNKKVVIIAQTAFALPGDRQKSIDAGCDDYISKPLNNAVLRKLIGEYFRAGANTRV
jgi:signal transduction histidine kinase/ActR/RegA family two-component response regulator